MELMCCRKLWLLLALLAAVLVCQVSAFFAPVADSTRIAPEREIYMKIFDWKARRGHDKPVLEDGITLDSFYRTPGSMKRGRRLGRGYSAGQGGASGKGMKGQNARSGGGKAWWFEGGQTPLLRASPKWPSKPVGIRHRRVIYNVIKTDDLNACGDGTVVSYQYLLQQRVIRKATGKPIHKIILGNEPLTARNQLVYAHAFTNSACQAILDNGGKCFVLSRTTHRPVSEITRPEQIKSIWDDDDDDDGCQNDVETADDEAEGQLDTGT